MGGGNPLKKAVNKVKHWDSNDWMMAAGVAMAGAGAYGAYGSATAVGAGGTSAGLGGVTMGQGLAMAGGTQLAMAGKAGKEAEEQEEDAKKAQEKADAEARALQDRLAQEDYLMRIQSGIDTKTSKSSKTQYGTGSTSSMTGGDLLIPISEEEKKKKAKVGLGF